MSHEHTVIDLADGLTVLAGPNNCGKSAVVTALQILCYNDPSTYVLRHGAAQCRVTVETDDGHVIRWSRKKNGSPRYEIDGQQFDRLGKGGGQVPAQVHEILRLPRVRSERDEFDVHFGTQREPVFLLNDSPGAAADFFASSSDAIRLVEMQSLHKQRVKQANLDQKRLTGEIAGVSDTLAALQPLEQALSELDRIEIRYRAWQDEQARIESLNITIRAWHCQQSAMIAQQRRLAELKPLHQPPNLTDVRSLRQLVSAIVNETATLNRTGVQQIAMALLDAPPTPVDSGPLQRLLGSLEQTTRSVNAAQCAARALQPLLPVPELTDTSCLQRLVQDLTRARRHARESPGFSASSSGRPLRRGQSTICNPCSIWSIGCARHRSNNAAWTGNWRGFNWT